MARKRFGGFRRRVSRSFSRRSRGRFGGGKDDIMGIALSGAIYGALRPSVATAIQPITSKIPLGDIGDEVGMGVLSYFIYKMGRGNKTIRNIGKAGMYIESARIGESLISGSLLGNRQTVFA